MLVALLPCQWTVIRAVDVGAPWITEMRPMRKGIGICWGLWRLVAGAVMSTVAPWGMSPPIFHVRATSYSGDVEGRSSLQGKKRTSLCRFHHEAQLIAAIVDDTLVCAESLCAKDEVVRSSRHHPAVDRDRDS